jgi:hypothetical protein
VTPLKTINAESRTANALKESHQQAKNEFKSKISKIKSVDSGYILTPKEAVFEKKLIDSESSGSIIKENSGQPHLIS